MVVPRIPRYCLWRLGFVGWRQGACGAIAGCDLPVRAYYVAGVFLDDSEPVDPGPDHLTIADIGFDELSPALNQAFFIGDGWMAEVGGTPQVFHVPDGATRLFLGYQDRCSTNPNLPGCYDDNSGTVTGSVDVSTATAAMPIRGTTLRLAPNFPNPFNPRTTISFALPQAGYCELAIYDSGGRLVRTLMRGWLEQGTWTRTWDGTDASGRAAASGVYICHLDGPGPSRSIRMALLR
jgi:hypothetical protein